MAAAKAAAERARRRWLAWFSVAAATLSAAGSARAQNTEGFYYSEDAALMAGAVTARPGDSASLWYNPAGLASIERGRITASGSVLGLRVRSFAHALDTVIGGETYSLDLHSNDVIAVPNALTGAFHLAGPVTLGVGLFVTTRDLRKAEDICSKRPSQRPRSGSPAPSACRPTSAITSRSASRCGRPRSSSTARGTGGR